jgi:hypothetical protein
MSDTVNVKLDEIKQVYELLERVNEFFHDPLNFADVERFAINNYPQIKNAYYQIVWNWLPPESQQVYEDR